VNKKVITVRTRAWIEMVGLAAAMTVLAACTNVAMPNFVPKENPFATKVPFITPARSAEAGALRSMVVVAGAPANSQQVAEALEGAMLQLRVDEKPFYAQVRGEASGKAGSSPTESALAGLARQHSSQGALGVYGLATDVRETRSQEDRVQCTERSPKAFKLCPKEKLQTRKVNCTETIAVAQAKLRVVRASDRRTVYFNTQSGNARHKQCAGDTGTPTVDHAQLLATAFDDMVAQTMKVIAPSAEMRALDFKSADNRIEAAKKNQFDGALEFARAKRMDEACSRFDELYDDNKESVALAYNVAFCHEVRGDLMRASTGYRRASDLNKAPDSQIDGRLAAVEALIKENPTVFMPAPAPRDNPAPTTASSGRRVALVIGNARYKKQPLANAGNDAALMRNELKRIGFDVTPLDNADRARMNSAIADFAKRAEGAEVALFYYAGHAVQYNNENFLLPVNNDKLVYREDVVDEHKGGFRLDDVVAMLSGNNGPATRLLILDACRDAPLPSRETGRTSAGSGLAPVALVPTGMLMAFATGPGAVAADGKDGRNSPYTKALAAELRRPGQSIEELFKRVRASVQKETEQRQTPLEINQLVGELVLVRKP
jgi:hypothetical protein